MAIDAQNFENVDKEDDIIDDIGPLTEKHEVQNNPNTKSTIAMVTENERTSIQSEIKNDCESKSHDKGYVSAQGESSKLQDGNEVGNGNEVSSSNNAEAELEGSIEEENIITGMNENGFNSDAQCPTHGKQFKGL